MTKKQQNILQAAIELFSKDGIHNTSTLKIAKKASVSEGLIFRHFKNKEGLILAVFNEVESQINYTTKPILEEEDAKQIIRETLEIPFKIKEDEYMLWKLFFLLKWDSNQRKLKSLDALKEKLTVAFSELRYRKPVLEAVLILHITKSTIISILQNQAEDKTVLQNFLLQKYYF